MFYVVIDENFFGGNFGVFDNLDDAKKHQLELNSTNLETFICVIDKLPFIRNKDNYEKRYINIDGEYLPNKITQ